TRSRNMFSWASASGTWRLRRTKNIFSPPTASRTTSPSSTSQILRSSRRSRSASFLGVSRFRSSDSFAVRFTPVGETTTFVFSAWEPTGQLAFAILKDREAGARRGGGCHSATHRKVRCDVRLASAGGTGRRHDARNNDCRPARRRHRRREPLLRPASGARRRHLLHHAIDLRSPARPQRSWKEYIV